LVCCHG